MRRCPECSKQTRGIDGRCEHCTAELDAPTEQANTAITGYDLSGFDLAAVAAVAVAVLASVVRALYPSLAGLAHHPGLLAKDEGFLWTVRAFIVTTIIAGLLTVTWLWRARKNLDAWSGSTAMLGSGWAIAGWFVPIANLVVPYHVVSQVASNSVRESWADMVVKGWWAAFVLQNVVGAALATGLLPTGAGMMVALLSVVAGVCISVVIVAVSRAQRAWSSVSPAMA